MRLCRTKLFLVPQTLSQQVSQVEQSPAQDMFENMTQMPWLDEAVATMEQLGGQDVISGVEV